MKLGKEWGNTGTKMHYRQRKGNKNCQKNKLLSYHGYILFYTKILAVINRHQIVVVSTWWEGEQHTALSVLFLR